MIKVACLSYNNVVINNFFHDEITLDYYNDLNLINFEKYKVFILLNSTNNVDSIKVINLVKVKFSGIIYLIDYKFQEKIMSEVLSMGINDYLVLPLDNNYLISKILNDINKNKNEVIKKFIYKDLIFDLINNRLYIDGKQVILTKIEYDILKLLCENVNSAISRKEISYKIWGYDLDDYRTIETHFKTLRKKLQKYKSNIITIWGYGYSFME
ncbi:MAG: response regulator transcription factor [Bacilli bacterium]|jgi:DNA-binding response OmpR family regulator|nr:response regulator transcription factor [Bacilli bacterium]